MITTNDKIRYNILVLISIGNPPDDVIIDKPFQVPRDPERPCELCYCIKNSTACVMQECTLKVEGCKPIFQDGVCCPVKYMCGKL